MKLKIALVGPSCSGKSYLANILGNEGMSDTSGIKPPYRPTHSVRIIEFSLSNVELRKYNLDVEVQLWEVGGNPSLKSIYPGVQSNVDGVILMYDVSKDIQIREASTYYMNFVTHSPSGLTPFQCLILGNKFRGAAEIGTQKIVGVPPKARHIALNIEDDPNRLREEVKSFISAVAQIVIDQEKANIAKHDSERHVEPYLSKRLSLTDYRRVKKDLDKDLQLKAAYNDDTDDKLSSWGDTEDEQEQVVDNFDNYNAKVPLKMRHKKNLSKSKCTKNLKTKSKPHHIIAIGKPRKTDCDY